MAAFAAAVWSGQLVLRAVFPAEGAVQLYGAL